MKVFMKKAISYNRVLIYLLNRLASNRVISLIISWVESNTFEKYSKEKLKHQPIFIIGAPRTGSTVFYQAITNNSDVLYFDNLVCSFYKNILFGFWLSNKLFKQKAHGSFDSEHGNTAKSGLHAPSECGSFWYRWLPKDRHFINYDDTANQHAKAIQREITAVSNYFNKPIVFKNLNAGQRLRFLSKIFPDARFIFLRRDPVYTTQSILLAKRKIGLPDNHFWSVMPANVDDLREMEWPEQIVKQVFYLEHQIAKDLQLFSKANIFEVDYLRISQESVNRLISKLGLKKRSIFHAPAIQMKDKLKLSAESTKMLIDYIHKLDWTKTIVK